MFGGKFRIWMEAHIVRPKKKNQRGKETPSAGVAVEVGEGGKNPPPPPQATTTPAPAPPVTGGGCKHSCSSGSGGSGGSGGGGSLEAMLSSGAAAPGASLSSPESAYSTGYSTDGTSPGASYPPEYYINIRTGTHYFQQAGARGPPPAPPPRVPAVKPSPSPPKQVDFAIEKSPAVQKKELPKRCIPPGHRRSESCDVGRARVAPQLPHVPPPPPLAASPSPRQRSRIRTNPWLGGAAPTRPGHSGAEDSCNGSSCSSARLSSGEGVSVSVKQPVKKVLGPCREASPVVRSPAPSVTWSPRRLNKVAASSSSSGSQRSSDDDLTLHEMMGKYDESYVYERETDILSDSDPTDCEDCGDTDADTGQDGGDEQDPDDLDFIDKDSFQDLNLSDSERGPRRLGHSNYYHFPNELSRKLSRHRDSSARRSTSGSRKRETSAKPRAPRRRRPRDPATRSLGGTPLSHRRKPLDDISEIRSHQSPVRMSVQRTLVIQDSRIDALKRRSNSVSYVSRTCAVKQSVPGGGFLANFDSEIALVEADKEADKKYKELILEAEHILVTMKASTPILGSPRRVMLNNPPPNKRVELLRNAECDLNPKVRGVDSVPGSPKLCGSPRFSPKKNHITNFMQINSPELSRRESNNNSSVNENIFSSPKKLLVHSPMVHKQVISKTIEPSRQSVRCPNSPRMIRRNVNAVVPARNMIQSNQPGSPILQLNGRNISTNSPVCRPRTPQPVSQVLHIDDDSDESTEKEQISVHKKIDISKKSPKKGSFLGRTPPHKGDNAGYNNNLAGTSSSSDDAEQIKKDSTDNRPPLLTFRSIDIGHRVPDSGYCPQSEPVKRKVYSGSATFDRLQKSLDSHHLIRQKSDGEASTVDDQGTDECRAGLREKVARLRAERLDAEERSRHRTDLLQQQQGQFQKQLTLFRRQMLLQTIEGLKKSLEDQSASLNQTYNGNEVKKNQTYNGNEVKKKNIESF